jgi:hypothetical protein
MVLGDVAAVLARVEGLILLCNYQEYLSRLKTAAKTTDGAGN